MSDRSPGSPEGESAPTPEPTPAQYVLDALKAIGIERNTEYPDESDWITNTEPHGAEPADSLADALQKMQRAAENDGRREAESQVASLSATVERLTRLATFGAKCLTESRRELSDLDGAWLEARAEECGVLVAHAVTEPCEKAIGVCRCEEFGFPVTCYRYADDLREFIVRSASPDGEGRKDG